MKLFHGYSARRGNHVSAAARELGAASKKSEVVGPVNGSPANSKLISYPGHECQVVSDCQWLGVRKKAFQTICRKSTALTVERDGRLIDR